MKKYYQILKETQVEPPYGLSHSISVRVHELERSTSLIRFLTFVSTTLVSSVALVIATVRLWNDLAQSGFYQYFSLLLSDGATLSLYWKQLGLSLVESLPLLNLALLLSVLGVFIWSGTKVIRSRQVLLLPA
jgi:hypothetical protein